jgi:RNA polymerase sigma-54 factor
MTTEAKLERLLIKIQNFDPPGIAARDLQECLLLQLYKKDYGDNPAIDLAEKLLSEQFEAFAKKHYDKIKKSLKINDEQLKAAMGEILKLNPKPGETGSVSVKTQYIVPDFSVSSEDGVLQVRLNGRNAPELRLSASYVETLKAYESSAHKEKQLRDAVQYIKQKVDGAKWFIDSVKQRQNTLMKTMQAIVQRQREFFLEAGDETKLRPMILKDIATQVELDISTISRVANSKYVETDFGIFPLKFFFSEGLTNEEGEEVSNREIKKILSDAIGQEDKIKPLTDESLMDLLKEKGYNIARRTVAKYREQLGIPVARLRKEL